MDAGNAIGFSRTARQLADEARRRGLVVPGFCSPPRNPVLARSLRRANGDDAPIVAVRRRGRSSAEVVADMIDGVVAANGLSGPAAEQLRVELARTVRADTV